VSHLFDLIFEIESYTAEFFECQFRKKYLNSRFKKHKNVFSCPLPVDGANCCPKSLVTYAFAAVRCD